MGPCSIHGRQEVGQKRGKGKLGEKEMKFFRVLDSSLSTNREQQEDRGRKKGKVRNGVPKKGHDMEGIRKKKGEGENNIPPGKNGVP